MNKIIKKILIVLIFVFVFTSFSCAKKEELLKFDIHTELQNKYLSGPRDNATLYAKGLEELSYPNPVTLTWKGEDKTYVVTLSLDENFENSKEYYTYTNKISIYNLYILKMYYYKVLDGEEEIVNSKFVITSFGPGNMYVDGLSNCRDVGGWLLDDNKIIKQGLIYRSSKLNNDESTDLVISEVGLSTLKKEFNIKTEIDLREVENNENGGITESPIGSDVNYVSIPMVSGGNILLLNKDKMKELFEVFGDSNNYPIIFHCSIGTDRTGLVSLLLLGLLEASEDDIYRDYAFSNFGLIYRVRLTKNVDDYLKTLKQNYNAPTLKEMIIKYLVDCGVELENINNFISLMKEDYKPYE